MPLDKCSVFCIPSEDDHLNKLALKPKETQDPYILLQLGTISDHHLHSLLHHSTQRSMGPHR